MHRIRLGPDITLILRPSRAPACRFYAVIRAGRQLQRIHQVRMMALSLDSIIAHGYHVLRRRATAQQADGPSVVGTRYLLTRWDGVHWYQHSPTKPGTAGTQFDAWDGKAKYDLLLFPFAIEKYLIYYPNQEEPCPPTILR